MTSIPSYSIDEFTSILKCQQKYKRLPEDADADQIRYHSGLVPRMIFFWCGYKRLHISPHEIRDDTGGFYDRATEFYRSEIRKTLNRAEKMDPLNKQKIHSYAAAVATNMSLPEPPSQWKITGLFVPKSTAWVYVCPPVIKAFVQHMVESYRHRQIPHDPAHLLLQAGARVL